MEIGTPLPANLDTLSIEEIEALRTAWEEERQSLRAKHLAVKPALKAKWAERNKSRRATGVMLPPQNIKPTGVASSFAPGAPGGK